MSYNKNHYDFVQTPTMSYKKALSQQTMLKAYESNTLVDNVENYLVLNSKLISDSEFNDFIDVNNPNAELQGLKKHDIITDPDTVLQLLTFNSHRFLSRKGVTTYPLYFEGIDPPIDIQTEAAVLSVFTVSSIQSNWNTIFSIPLSSPGSFNLGKYGTYDDFVHTLYDRNKKAISNENFEMYQETSPFFWSSDNKGRIIISYSSFQYQEDNTITTRLRLFDVASNTQLCDVYQRDITETSSDLNSQNRDKFFIFPLGHSNVGYIRYMKTLPNETLITSLIKKLYNEFK